MSTKKKCDKCGTSLDVSISECPNCFGTTFTHIKEEQTLNQEPVSLRNYTPQSKVDYQAGFIEGLLDTSFDKYITKSIVRFAYTLALAAVLILELLAVLGLWTLLDVSNAESIGPFLALLLSLSAVTLILLYLLATTRVALESATALIQIANNTSKNEQ